jgi:hypothetical protein
MPAPPLPQDAYVWQRQWTPALRSALKESSDLIAQWRVLAAETDAGGMLRPVAVDWAALGRTGRPVIAVIRLDGALVQWREAALLDQVQALAIRWRNIRLAGLEIDFDCGTARLPAYAQFLEKLRALSGLPHRLSITALPAWLASPTLDRVLAATDEAVLQVHAVRRPQDGLFDPDTAPQWIDAFDARTAKPFLVALPDYGARAIWSDDGRLVAVESEMPRLAGGGRTSDLVAFPDQVARLLSRLRREPRKHLAGIVWFRLPTDDDALTWSLGTWRAVMRGDDLQASVSVMARATAVPGMADIVLANSGRIDAALPRRITLPPGCRIADGINGYGLVETNPNIVLERLQSALLRAQHERTIGWMRCAGALDVEP